METAFPTGGITVTVAENRYITAQLLHRALLRLLEEFVAVTARRTARQKRWVESRCNAVVAGDKIDNNLLPETVKLLDAVGNGRLKVW